MITSHTMADFVPCSVEARFLPDGRPIPHKVTWDGVERVVVTTGRMWQEATQHHVLVQLSGQITLELKYDGAWSGRPVSKPRFSSI
ncbi:MAG: hypothetical protein L0154_31120 [Chloroflexi bacterium]|nr:hypothetical protein [Chloroflexota bacterium]